MAVKDTAPFLEECLLSILDQTYIKWELIAVNDHSVDASPVILRDFAMKDPRIRIFESKGRRLIPALQTGYEHAEGTLVNRMDSDDKMPPDKLEVLVNEWQKFGKGTVIAGGTRHFVDNGEVGGGFLRYEKWLNAVARDGRHLEEIYRECVIPSHSWIMHRDDFDGLGAFDPMVYPEDYDLCFRIYKRGMKVVGIDKILHYWRDRSDRISRTWEEYKDNRYFELKLKYFYELDRDLKRPLVLWGAGRNGKDLARGIKVYENTFSWVCENPNKVGHSIYGVRLRDVKEICDLTDPQILVGVASVTGQQSIGQQLDQWGKRPVSDYWFFL